jgi:hypothetical protein
MTAVIAVYKRATINSVNRLFQERTNAINHRKQAFDEKKIE